jgi:hypothetical protein
LEEASTGLSQLIPLQLLCRQPALLPLNTDRWYYCVFQSVPDLIRALLPGSAAAANTLCLDPSEPGDRL